MPYKGNDWQPTRDEAAAEITSDRYADEHDNKIGELVGFENGVRKYWADQLRAAGETVAADLLDPYNDHNGTMGLPFSRTLAEGEPGANWFKNL